MTPDPWLRGRTKALSDPIGFMHGYNCMLLGPDWVFTCSHVQGQTYTHIRINKLYSHTTYFKPEDGGCIPERSATRPLSLSTNNKHDQH